MATHAPNFDRLMPRLAGDERVDAAYRFGSRARGTARADSDVDIALLLNRTPAPDEELRLRADAASAPGIDDADPVLLRAAAPLLRYEVVARGRRLYARAPDRVDEFERRTAMACFDTAHLRAVQARLTREALAPPAT